jgi:hypothetical protein
VALIEYRDGTIIDVIRQTIDWCDDVMIFWINWLY